MNPAIARRGGFDMPARSRLVRKSSMEMNIRLISDEEAELHNTVDVREARVSVMAAPPVLADDATSGQVTAVSHQERFREVLRMAPHKRSPADIDEMLYFLKGVDEEVLTRLGDADLRRLCSIDMTWSQFDKGHMVFSAGDPSPCCYLILTGVVGVYVYDPTNPAQGKLVAVMRAGGPKICFGELGLLENKPRSASMQVFSQYRFFLIV